MRSVLWLLAIVAGAEPIAAQQGTRLWRPDERVVLSDAGWVDALAASDELLFVATPNALALYEWRFRRWREPVSPLDGYPTERVLAALADPVDGSVWLGTEAGAVRYAPALRTFERVPVPGGVFDLMLDADDPMGGVYLRARSGWLFLPRGGLFPNAARLPGSGRVATLGVDEALRRLPFLDARSPDILTDAQLRRYRLTAAVRAPRTEEYFFGTNGRGVLHVDGTMAMEEWLPFGVPDARVGAVAIASGGVWIGPGPGAERVAFAFVRGDLSEFRVEEGPRATGFGFRYVQDLTMRGREVWAATDAGVVRFEPGSRAADVLLGTGFSGAPAHALALVPAGVWVGSHRGLAFVDREGDVSRADERVVEPILALAVLHDTVWVGGLRGLGFTWTGAEEILASVGGEAGPYLREPIVALTVTGHTLVGATTERLLWRDHEGRWTVERILAGELGRIGALAPEEDGVWVGGERGIGYFQLATRALFAFASPGDVPGPVRDLAADREYLWVATDEGLVRFRKDQLIP